MISKNKLVVSEFVSYGHPDKLADEISDAILDAYLKVDKNARTGIEVMVKDNIVVLGGEIHSNSTINYEQIVRDVFRKINYPQNHHLTPNEIKVINLIGKQSEEIHSGVDKNENIGAGDQGFMVGFASNETSVYMPLGHYLAKTICNYVANEDLLGPDTKSQVIVEYNENGKAIGICNILVSTMHQCSLECVRERVEMAIKTNAVGIDENIYETFIKNKNIKIDVNPCGTWRIGGSLSDCGVTGRKLVVDAYGGYCNIGGGNYSGKDFSKVDRSAAYMARYLAKNIVASGFSDTAKVTLSYMIGVAQPYSLEIETNRNWDKINGLKKWIVNNINLTPTGIIKRFNGTYPQFYLTSRDGHYGFNYEYSFDENGKQIRKWEDIDIAKDIMNAMFNNVDGH